jgi:hypothetical protein
MKTPRNPVTVYSPDGKAAATPPPEPLRVVIVCRNATAVWFSGKSDVETTSLYKAVCDNVIAGDGWIRSEKVVVRAEDIVSVQLA